METHMFPFLPKLSQESDRDGETTMLYVSWPVR